jgi:hypothetical protein
VDPHPRDRHVPPGAAADPARSRPADDQRSAPLQAPPRAGTSLHRHLLGPARLRPLAAQTPRPGRHHPGPDGERHGVASGSPPGPLRREDIRRRVLLRRDARGVRRRAASGPGRDAGSGGNGHRRHRRRHQCLRLRAQHGPPARPPARDPAATGHRPAPAPDLQTVHHPGPLGDQLRRSHDRRNLRHPGPRAARQPGPLTRLPGRGHHPDRPRHHRDPGRSAARARQHGPGPDPASPRRARRHGARPPRPGGAGAAAQRYASTLQAPGKRLVWFDNSAHTPHLEEPGKFRDLLLGIREPKMQQDVTLGSGQPRQTQP